MRLLTNMSEVVISGQIRFEAVEGTAPYVYSIICGSGSIDSSTGVFTATNTTGVVKVKATDATDTVVEKEISVLSHLQLVCSIFKTDLGLDDEQVFIYNQELRVPKKKKMFISVGVQSSKVFANTAKPINDQTELYQSISVQDVIEVNIYSENFEALENKEDVPFALSSNYSLMLQEAFGFRVAKIPTQINNISGIDGPSIPYRFNFTFNLLYSKNRIKSVEHYDSFTRNVIFNK